LTVTTPELAALAKELLDNLLEDVDKAKTREEHIRITARANEAAILLSGINQVYHDDEES
jgi:hypothetical protein